MRRIEKPRSPAIGSKEWIVSMKKAEKQALKRLKRLELLRERVGSATNNSQQRFDHASATRSNNSN